MALGSTRPATHTPANAYPGEENDLFEPSGKFGDVTVQRYARPPSKNLPRKLQKVSGIDKVHAIIGGFHLMPMPLDYVRNTVAALKEINPDVLIPMHCSGTAFYEIAKQEMPGRVLLSSTGTRFTFGA